MENLIRFDDPMFIGFAVLSAVVLTVMLLAWLRWSRSMPVRITRALKAISHEMLRDIFLPDGVGGHIHIDALLLTNRGLLVLEIKDIHGVIFGANQMDEWVVLQQRRRHTFNNPLHALRDRIGSVRSIAKDIYTEGYCVFTEHGRFEKGMPPETVMLHDLVETVGPAGNDYPQAFAEAWRIVSGLAERAQALPSTHD